MRGLGVRSIRQIRSILRHQGYNCLSRSLAGKRSHFIDERLTFVYKPFDNVEILKKGSILFYGISRALSTVVEPGKGGPLMEYERRIAAGELSRGDSCQLGTINELQRLYDELVENADRCKLDRFAASKKSSRSRWLWSRLLHQSSHSPVKGLYLYGGVGTGKTMLMDLFFDQVPSHWRKKRTHFYDFMLGVHSRLQRHKGVADPLELVAEEISDESILLCLDEFMVTDIGIAWILHRLFEHLFSNGVILIATSNRPPDGLYEGEQQSNPLLPFIATLKERCKVHDIASSVDYRRLTSQEQGFYFIGKDLSSLLKAKFQELVADEETRPHDVEVGMGRTLKVPFGAKGCAYFLFDELCDRPLGAADYLGLFKIFHTLALEGMPIFGLHNRATAYRFVTLVDVMYDNKARLLCTAGGSPQELFKKIITIAERASQTSTRSWRNDDDANLCVDKKLGFAKYRTISRLTEMNSKEYLEQHATVNQLA